MIRLAALLLLVASLAHATTPGKALVIVDRVDPQYNTANRTAAYQLQEGQLPGWVRQIMNGWGISHRTVLGSSVTTEMARTGKMVWGYGTGHATAEQFDAVVVVNFHGRHQWGAFSSFHPESLTLSDSCAGTEASHGRSLPAVPVLFIAGHITAVRSITHTALADTANDTTGCNDFDQTLGTSGVSGSQSVPKNWQYGFPEVYRAGCYTTSWVVNAANPPAGGLRKWIGEEGVSALEVAAAASSNGSSFITCGFCDSIDYAKAIGATGDNVQVWERPMSHVTGAKPIVFVWPFGYQQCQYDSVKVSTENYTACEFDPWSVVMGLARLDSLTGGRLIQKPITAAPVIEGIASRSYFRNPGGIAPDDTLALYTSIDSLRLNPQTAKIRWTLAANPDSLSLYANEIAHWKLLPMVRWTPLQMRGVADTTKSGGYGADPFGRYRFRFAVGDGSGVGKDSSITSLLRYGRDKVIAGTQGQLSGLCVAPFDDWSPKNMDSKWSGSPGRDSVLYAVQKSGHSCLLVNSQRTDNGIAGVGYTIPGQTTIGGGTPSYRLNLLAHSGYAINGSALQWDMRTYGDSVTVFGTSNDKNYHFGACPCPPQHGQYALPDLIAYECQRFTASMLFTRFRDWDFMPARWVDPYDDVNTPLADMIFDLQHGSIFRMSAQDFGSGYHTPATRPGYWRIKSMANAFAIANRIAGREVLQWAWPEDITP